MTTTVQAAEHVTAEALFASHLQPSQHPDNAALTAAVTTMLAQLGCDGCMARVAVEFGDHPDTAAARMRWALDAETALCAHDQPTGGAR